MPVQPLLCIQHKKLKLELAVVNVKELHCHEETSSEFVDRLMKRIKGDQMVKHPVLVDKGTLTILDGTHRFMALKKLGCRWMPVCLMNYRNPAIRVDCWYRTITSLKSDKQLFSILKRLKLSLTPVTKEKAENAVRRGETPAAILTRQISFIIASKPLTLWQKYQLIKKIENALKKSGALVSYKYPREAKLDLERKLVDAIIVVPPIDKESVIKAALTGKIFTQKATRHIIPARILNLFIPLITLKMRDLTKVNVQLMELLRGKKPRFLPAGSTVGGRTYEEEVYVFETVR